MIPANAAAELMRSGRQYNNTAAQRARILDRLRRGPASRLALESECGVSCATKRISELRRAGWLIDSAWLEGTAPDGSATLTTLYCLIEPNSSQADLFEAA